MRHHYYHNKHRYNQQPRNERINVIFFSEKRIDLKFRNALINSYSKLNRTNSRLLLGFYQLNLPCKPWHQSYAQHPQTVYSIRTYRKCRGNTTTSITMGTGDYL